MENQPSAVTKPSTRKRILIVILILGIVFIATLGGVWTYYKFWVWDTTGLEGTWRDPANPAHTLSRSIAQSYNHGEL